MQQVYHYNAGKNLNFRSQIQSNAASNSVLAPQLSISEQMVNQFFIEFGFVSASQFKIEKSQFCC